MKADPAVTRLSAGLDRDAEIAQAARVFTNGTPWRFVPDPHGSHHWAGSIEDEPADGASENHIAGCVGEVAWGEHIANFDPARSLRQVEAIRKVIADVRDPNAFEAYASANIDHTSFMEGVEAAAELFVRALAGIYTDEAEETP